MVTRAIGVNTIAELVVGFVMVMLSVVISMILMMVTLITQGETSEHRDKNQHSTGLHDGLE